MEQHTDSQYDDDLTVGIEDVDDDSFDTGFVDLFEFSGEEESPIARLKTIVLSIDWEITDEVLNQFSEELIDLKDIWADDPIKLVYVQALEKLGKYIFEQKGDSHPQAIRLLLTFYYNLEKIVLDDQLSDADKKSILRADVRKFDKLKSEIETSPSAHTAAAGGSPGSALFADSPAPVDEHEQGATHPLLFNLKASILGLDWEITERELGELSREIRKLETTFAGHKPRMLFLQGIEALGGYIKFKKSDAHADAFKLLYSFFEGLEKIVVNRLTYEQEKAVLLPEVDKFEAFKKIVAPTLSYKAAPQEEGSGVESAFAPSPDGQQGLTPAFADMPDNVHGFQAENERETFDDVDPDVEDRLEHFFSDDSGKDVKKKKDEKKTVTEDSFVAQAEEKVSTFFLEDEEDDEPDFGAVSAEDALRGVEVETEADDDTDEEALPTESDGKLAPALAGAGEQGPTSARNGADQSAEDAETAAAIEDRLGSFFDDAEDDFTEKPDAAAALAGVDVESEADNDDYDEEPLAFAEDDLAPALFGSDDDEEENKANGFTANEEIDDRLDTLFTAGDDGLPDTKMEMVDDIESRLDAFFPEEVSDNTDADVFMPTSAQEEVVFETVSDEDESDLFADDVPDGLVDDEQDETAVFSTFDSEDDEQEFFAAIDERVDEPGEFQMEILEEIDEFDTSSPVDEHQVDVVEEDAVAAAFAETMLEEPEPPSPALQGRVPVETQEDAEEFVFSSDDGLGELRAGIASLGVEISDSIVNGILNVINDIRQRLSNGRAVNKTFLQLISTVVRHIGQYQYEASSEAHGLLLSVFDKLERVQDPKINADQAQEILFAETCKVLLWQQKMLDRQAIKKGDQLTFIDPLRSETSEIKEGDFSAVFKAVEETDDYDLGRKNGTAPIEVGGQADLSLDPFAGLIKKEIAGLRDYLLSEIGELKRQLKYSR